MANKFIVEAKVTFVNELFLDFHGVDMLKRGETPTRHRIKDKNLVNESEILILRVSDEFRKAFELDYISPIVLKTRY